MANPYHDAKGEFTGPGGVTGGVTIAPATRKVQALEELKRQAEVPQDEKWFNTSFGGKDYGPEVSMRGLGFERDTHLLIGKGKGKVQDIPLDKIVVIQPSATKGLVAQYIEHRSSEPIDVVAQGGKFVASSGTHRLAAAKLLGDHTIKASVHVARALSASRRGR